MVFIVYQTTNLINQKIYIGIHKTNQIEDGYLGSGVRLKDAIRKYGIDNFQRKVLYIFDNEEEALKKEGELVTEDFVSREDTYNLAVGGQKTYPKCTFMKPGEVSVKNSDGSFERITREEYELGLGDYIHNTYNRVTVKDKSGITFSVYKDDPRYLSGELVPYCKGIPAKHNIGKVAAKDKDGNVFQASTDDPRFETGEITSYHTGLKRSEQTKLNVSMSKRGKVKAVFSDDPNKHIYVLPTDSRFETGEIYRAKNHKRKFTAVDKNGNKYRIYRDDPRYISGELKPTRKRNR